MILGVPVSEGPSGIRSAYRDLAKKLHPDVAGEQATRAFQEVTEAYDVLSDPQRRRDYNEQLRRAGNRDGQDDDQGQVPIRRSPPRPIVREPISILEDVDGLDFEVLLTPAEAMFGCVVPELGVRIPPRVPSGSIFAIPLQGLGIHDFYLRLHVVVGG